MWFGSEDAQSSLEFASDDTGYMIMMGSSDLPAAGSSNYHGMVLLLIL